MRKLLFIFLLAMVWFACTKTEQTPASIQSSNSSNATKGTVHKRIVLHQGGDQGLYINGHSFSYQPGDTFVLTGNWSYCTLEDVYGDPSNYVVMINQGSQVQ